jgi:arabinofuranosyltransferase
MVRCPEPAQSQRMTPTTRMFAVALAGVTTLIFALHVHEYYFIGDDAFISFRYAHHLVNGQGLVWNPGEYVEGYTNFLWVLLMAAAMKVGLSPEWASNALGIVSGTGVLVVVSILAVRLSTRRTLLVGLPALVLALSRTFTAWTTGGLETMLFTLLITAALLVVFEERRRNVDVPIGSAALLSLAALTRPEGILFAGIVGAWLMVETIRLGHRWRPVLIWVAVVGLTVGTHFFWRHAYYEAWLPNTFAAKVPAAWWHQGLRYAYDFTRAYGVPLFMPLVGWTLWRQPDPDRLLSVACVSLYVVYVLAIGGDRFEFRFWVPVLPLTYWLITDSLEQLPTRFRLTAILVVVLLAATIHGSWQADRVQLPRWHGINSVAAIKEYAARRIAEGRILHELIEAGSLSPQLVLAVTGAGAVPYYTDWPTVDRHGLNDRYIAHLPVTRRGIIAHEHDAPEEYLERRKVMIDDVLNQLVFQKPEPIPGSVERFGEPRALYIADIGDAYLVFASFAPEAEVQQAFSRLSNLSVRYAETSNRR